jgi:hypothetical protein
VRYVIYIYDVSRLRVKPDKGPPISAVFVRSRIEITDFPIRGFRCLLHFILENARIAPLLSHDYFLPRPFLWIITRHFNIRHRLMYTVKKLVRIQLSYVHPFMWEIKFHTSVKQQSKL